VIEALRSTLLEVEQTPGIPFDDPAFLHLKAILVRRIANLEAEQFVAQSVSPALDVPSESSDSSAIIPADC